ncbi:BTB domain-containing protein [Penicillium ucsense]|uniref:BTB domain-containing protein n=1 Tax=Penicillium ucsense TaxID=2839758 RepID=A0A8J8WMM1_9EURO|nr:BTB domain-containing protein [Penicillium ucsense]KAF7724447.1 BTB domain-containing protein [Penicillium ucsense]
MSKGAPTDTIPNKPAKRQKTKSPQPMSMEQIAQEVLHPIPKPDTDKMDDKIDPLHAIPSASTHTFLPRAYCRPEYSDMTIICKQTTFPAHRVIVCPQLDFFREKCTGSEAANEPVRISDVDPLVMQKILQYLYTGDYDTEFVGQREAEETGHEVVQPGGSERESIDGEDSDEDRGDQARSSSASDAEQDRMDVSDETVRRSGNDRDTSLASDNDADADEDADANANESPEETDSDSDSNEDNNADDHANDSDSDDPCNANIHLFHLLVYKAASQLQIPPLAHLATRRFRLELGTGISRAELEEVIRELYSSEDRFWPRVRRIAIREIVELIHAGETDYSGLMSAEVLRDNPALTLGLCTALMEKVAHGK